MADLDSEYASFRLKKLSNKTEMNVKLYCKNNATYHIINQKKNNKKTDEYRSVIFAEPENRLLCFSPPKSIRYEKFKDDNHDITEQILVNEIIEGVMINLFYDFRISSWELATKFAVGCNYNFYGETKKNKTFREMFLECLRSENDLNLIPLLETFPKNYCYSFVMQHPKNKIALLISEPKLYLVALYDIHEDNRVTSIPANVYEEWTLFQSIQGIIEFPKRKTFISFTELEENVLSIHNGPSSLGKMLHNTHNGDRSYIQNPGYKKLKSQLNPMIMYQYLCINRMDKQKEVLALFPEFISDFTEYKNEYETFVRDTYICYIEHYIEKNDKQISDKYLSHIKVIHKTIYLPSLKHKKIIIRKNTVREYFKAMSPRELLYHLNYDRRMICRRC
jgi:hypothetical protein